MSENTQTKESLSGAIVIQKSNKPPNNTSESSSEASLTFEPEKSNRENSEEYFSFQIELKGRGVLLTEEYLYFEVEVKSASSKAMFIGLSKEQVTSFSTFSPMSRLFWGWTSEGKLWKKGISN